jgi:hypothetical protein
MFKAIESKTTIALPKATITATSSGSYALDSDSFGGNPFATALIGSLGVEITKSSELFQLLKTTTEKQSNGMQTPDLLQVTNEPLVPFSAQFNGASKIAMVMVYSDYSSSRYNSLPGAEFDLKRIRKALEGNGFECWALLDPTNLQLEANLKAFSKISNNYDFSVLYVTGHGVEIANNIYLLPSGYKFTYDKTVIEAEALNISTLIKYQTSRRGNFLFYGGCRNAPS